MRVFTSSRFGGPKVFQLFMIILYIDLTPLLLEIKC